MSDFAKSVPAAIAHTRPHVTGRDREFLPAALEILESPPPPAPVAFMMAICAFFALALVWAFVAGSTSTRSRRARSNASAAPR